ncbi:MULTISPECIES: efflux RND transporter periplasmic adaptor subunit [Helicobacter]|uniref:efflux RND transporter periplasmic adaptor subunit n=1 Tax=Helicobacter TaxID=209 RepID=UPI000DCB9672|nr:MULTISPECIES: efflux RND transporter periplasmic adaptor subunit [Helicobacter]MCL9821426.1 efflux RND transporter periplasmic adaptor subunit [Helicobacter colisuis]RAX52819.1 transporter [Helicobacter sp. 11-8110]
MRQILISILCFLPLFGEGIYATFNIQATQSATLSLASNGVIEEIFVEVGDFVEKGEKLLTLKAKDLQENVKIAKATLDSARIEYNFLESQYKRYQSSKNVIDKNTFERIQSQYQSSLYAFKKAQANYDLQKELLDKTILYAPFSGVISNKFVEVGDGVGAISSKLFVLESKQKKAMIEFDSQYFSQVKVGDKFQYKLQNIAQKDPLILTKIYPSIDMKTKKAKAEALLKRDLPSGIFGDGLILGQ